MNRFLREPSSSKGYNTKRLKSLESGYENGVERIQAVPAPKRAKISKPKHPVTKLPAAAIGRKLPSEPYQLPSSTECYKCRARKFAFETAHFCCCDGEVQIAANDYPALLVRLLTSMDEDAKHFRQYIRLYNNMFAFTSLGGKFDAKTKKGIYVFKLHGQLYHYIPYLLPGKEGPKYMQLYFYDGELEAKKRLGYFPELREDVLAILMEVTKVNPYARFFRSLGEIQITESTQILINKTTVPDQRVYNAPSTDEVAVIWPENTSSSEAESPHILVTAKKDASEQDSSEDGLSDDDSHANDSSRKKSCHRIMHYYGCYDPLQYPLLFPYGDCGWTQGLKKMSQGGRQQLQSQLDPVSSCSVHTAEDLLEEEARRANGGSSKTDRNISAREYYAYKLQCRPNNMLLRAGRCFQQYIVDMYVKVENTRLDFFRRNQQAIRADLYQGILDTIDCGENCAANVGHRVILPPTFIGGPRDLKKRYLNAMSLVQRFGKPDLFVTMTCNANWPEIKQELAVGEKAQDRPDIVARIFRAKVLSLKHLIKEKKVFGEVAAMIYVIEFQKRGLPHAHFLIILQQDHKIKCPADFDKFVCAEIPSIDNMHLRKVVLKHMMHGPCGHLDPECPCMKHKESPNRCKYGYPKQYCDETRNNSDGYPLYRRRDTGETVTIRKAIMDNRWVIPYNPYLSSYFDCHLNVEVCSTIEAVKYLYKYVYKGHDKISFTVVQSADVTPVQDEIQQYQSGRWVSPCEAAWRLFGFALYEMHPTVLPLPVHLPNSQIIQLRPHEQLTSVVSDNKRSRTCLTEFFRMNCRLPPGTGWLYNEFSEHYRWDASDKRWYKRQNKKIVIGRLAFVGPSEGERYYLRLLLHNVKGPKSFEDLRTVDGHLCDTFHQAALKLKLLEEDDSIDLCMKEGCAIQMPLAVRKLFATVLIFCQPNDPVSLWVKYYPFLSEDFRHKYGSDPQKVKHSTVKSVEWFLESMGSSLATYGLDHLVQPDDDEIRRTKDIEDALNAPIPDQCLQCKNQLNQAQREAFNVIMDHVIKQIHGAFFIDGPGGTGKTFLYNALYAEIRLMNKIVLPTATSGIAAANIPSGRTAHSRFKIPLDPLQSLACNVSKQSSLAALLKETTLIIWDEASMAKKENIESLDVLLRDICNPNLLFGGKIVVFGGDFRQVLPVVPKRTQREAVSASLVSSALWPLLIKFRLTENIRARLDPAYAAFLLALGNGQLQDTEDAFVQLPTEIVQPYDAATPQDMHLTSVAFPEMDMPPFSADIFTTRAILTPINDDVDTINAVLIEKFPGEAVTYKSYDSMIDDNCNIYPTEFLNKLCPGGMSPHELVLKPNSPIILLRNILPSSGLCNGTRLICKKFFPNLIECVIAVGHHKGEHVLIPRINLRPSESSGYPFQFQRKQFPLKLSFAMTINKAQGQTLNKVVVYLPRSCFSHGQLYVALSRARQAANVSVITDMNADQSTFCLVKNIVSYDILHMAGII